MRNIPSPQIWIDFGWYFLIGAALQRRVWLYDDARPLFANSYVCFVGPPGSGKGLILGPIADILRHHKKLKGQRIKTSIGYEMPGIFPVGADSITFEALVADVASGCGRIPTPNGDQYVHCSYTFVLEELSSLFKHKTQDVVKFLTNAYDCKSYDYKTKHQGCDIVRNLCMSFIAGTQQDFLKEATDAHIFTQGFASRALFLFETTPRFERFHLGELDEEQKQGYKEILEWVKHLSTLYGKVTYDSDTYAFLEDWYIKEFVPQKERATGKMQTYFARKKVIMLKLAMAIHFSESTELTIHMPSFEKAITLLTKVEITMAAGLNMAGRNELHLHGRQIMLFIKEAGKAGRSKSEIVLEFGADLDVNEIESCIKELELGYGVKKSLGGKKNYYVG